MVTLFGYQQDAVEHIQVHDGRALLAFDMGLGKTIIILATLQAAPNMLPALVVCPASVKYSVWEHEAKSKFGWRVNVCEGTKPPNDPRGMAFASQTPPITVINYDILHKWVPYLQSLGIKTVIYDECQRLTNPKTKRTKAAKVLSRQCPYMIASSGSPMMNRPAELWPVLNMLWPMEFGSFWSYGQQYCDPKYTPWGWEYKGATDLDDLHQRLVGLGMLRKMKKDVLKDLPPKIRGVVPCRLAKPQWDDYHEALTNFKKWIKRNASHKVQKVKKFERLVQIGYLLRLIGKHKLRSVVQWCNEFLQDTDEKLIVFAVHQKAINVLHRRIAGKSVVVNGAVASKHRKMAVDQFQRDPKTRVFIGNVQAAGEGLDLTAASTVAMAELHWNPMIHMQAEDRPYRIGQESTVWIKYFLTEGTIEERLCSMLQAKAEYIATVMSGNASSNTFNLYDDLCKELEHA